MPGIDELFESAVQLHRTGNLEAAQRGYRDILAQNPRHAGALNQLGLIARQSGRYAAAIDYLRQAIEIDGSRVACYANLAETYRALERLPEAINCYNRAIQLAPNSPPLRNLLGTLLRQAGRRKDALASFRLAQQLEPNDAETHINLGNVYLDLEQNQPAIVSYTAALAIDPKNANTHLSLGAAYKESGQLAEARRSFQRVLELDGQRADAWVNLGVVAKAEGNLAEATTCYERAIQLRPEMIEAHNNLAELLRNQGQMPAAVEQLEKALAVNPSYLPAHVNLAELLLEQEQTAKAIAHLERAAAIDPGHAAAHAKLADLYQADGRIAESKAAFGRALSAAPSDVLSIKAALAMPIILESTRQIDETRRQLADNLAQLEFTFLSVLAPAESIGPAFHLAYLGHNERETQARISRLMRKATPSLTYTAPHCKLPRRDKAPGQKIKIGFVSNHLHAHTISKLNAGIIQKLDRERFEVSVFRGPGHDDTMSRSIDQSADLAVCLSEDLAAAREQIAAQALDVVYYLDIGMESFTYFLAHARLAPVQCVTWGHPLTTGIDTVDYFVSSVDLEPEGAEAHYTEKLVRLPHLTNYYFRPDPPSEAKSRADFGFSAGEHIYLCPQSLFKLHPDNDLLLRGILQQDPLARIILLEPKRPMFRVLLSKRLAQSLGELAGRVGWVARQPIDDFRRLLASADVLLDPLHFGGGDTSYEAFAVGTPIVTLPGEFLRSRITYALYRTMGLDDGVALDRDDYVRRAVQLATDSALNAEVRARILAANARLYENKAAVRELEDFLIQTLTPVGN